MEAESAYYTLQIFDKATQTAVTDTDRCDTDCGASIHASCCRLPLERSRLALAPCPRRYLQIHMTHATNSEYTDTEYQPLSHFHYLLRELLTLERSRLVCGEEAGHGGGVCVSHNTQFRSLTQLHRQHRRMRYRLARSFTRAAAA